MNEIALKTISICQAFLDGEIDSTQFKASMMNLAFIAAGVSDDEMQAFNSVLHALYDMKAIGRNEVLNVFKNVKGSKREIVAILEEEPIRQVPPVEIEALPNSKGDEN